MIKRFVPPRLQSHLDGDAITICLLTRFKLKDGRLVGLTNLDRNVPYDPATYDPGNTGDDWGEINHRADNGGVDLSSLEHAAELTVDNAEFSILPGDDSLTPQELISGVLDSAEVHMYLVNYMDLTMGHICIGKGRLGETRLLKKYGTLEYRSLTDQLKQEQIDLVSIPCPYRFGFAPQCPKSYAWTDGTVTAVDGDQPTRIFADTGMAPADNFYSPGVVLWVTGDNAGQESDIDQNTAGTFALSLPTHFAIKPGDQFKVRQDCSKIWDDDDHGCRHHWGIDWNLYFGGFPDTPTADNGAGMIPGAQIDGG